MTRYSASVAPRGAVRAAVGQATTWARSLEEGVAIGIGFKHKGRVFIRPRQLCVKVFVRRKQEEPEHPVPREFIVKYRGHRYRIASDVEELKGVVQQGLVCFANAEKSRKGSVGLLCHGSDTKSVAVTAGHVLHVKGDASVGKGATGEILDDAVAFLDKDGLMLDVGAIELDDFPVRFLQEEPWLTLDQIRPWSELWRLFPKSGGEPSSGLVFGAAGTVTVKFDALIEDAFPFPVKNDPTLAYAPPLLHYRAIKGKLGGGYSGAPVTDVSASELLGLHVLGTSRRGYAQGASLLFGALAKRLKRQLTMY